MENYILKSSKCQLLSFSLFYIYHIKMRYSSLLHLQLSEWISAIINESKTDSKRYDCEDFFHDDDEKNSTLRSWKHRYMETANLSTRTPWRSLHRWKALKFVCTKELSQSSCFSFAFHEGKGVTELNWTLDVSDQDSFVLSVHQFDLDLGDTTTGSYSKYWLEKSTSEKMKKGPNWVDWGC